MTTEINLENIYEGGGESDQQILQIGGLDEIYEGGLGTLDEIYEDAVVNSEKRGGRVSKSRKQSITSSIKGGSPGNECAFYLGKIVVCSSPETQEKLRALLAKNVKDDVGRDDEDPKKIPVQRLLEKLLKIFKCSSESELLEHPAVKEALGYSTVEKEKKLRFKPHGPKNYDWFSNFDIDSVLNQWRLTFEGFYNFQFHMINFEELRKPLATITPMDIYKKGYNCYGCVMNTDRYDKNGEHWMALFVDFRTCPTNKCKTIPKIIMDDVTEADLMNVGLESTGAAQKTGTGSGVVGSDEGVVSGGALTPITPTVPVGYVEFFNSSGRRPQKEIVEWMNKTAENMKLFCVKVIKKYNTEEHQKSQSECGPYSMYYIWNRLNGKTASELMDKRIPDATVNKFRDDLFRDFE